MSAHGWVGILMGVSGCGKTSVGQTTADRLKDEGVIYEDADPYHPQANIDKMASGQPLDDHDREPWLRILADKIQGWLKDGKKVLLGCSALKPEYRAMLFGKITHLPFNTQTDDTNTISATSSSIPSQPAPAATSSSPFIFAAPSPSPFFIVHLKGTFDVLWKRISQRKGHYMKSNMLESQFATLVAPTPEECASLPCHLLVVDIDNNSMENESAQIADFIKHTVENST